MQMMKQQDTYINFIEGNSVIMTNSVMETQQTRVPKNCQGDRC